MRLHAAVLPGLFVFLLAVYAIDTPIYGGEAVLPRAFGVAMGSFLVALILMREEGQTLLRERELLTPFALALMATTAVTFFSWKTGLVDLWAWQVPQLMLFTPTLLMVGLIHALASACTGALILQHTHGRKLDLREAWGTARTYFAPFLVMSLLRWAMLFSLMAPFGYLASQTDKIVPLIVVLGLAYLAFFVLTMAWPLLILSGVPLREAMARSMSLGPATVRRWGPVFILQQLLQGLITRTTHSSPGSFHESKHLHLDSFDPFAKRNYWISGTFEIRDALAPMSVVLVEGMLVLPLAILVQLRVARVLAEAGELEPES